MNCDEVRELAPWYVSGELDASRAGAVRLHLDSCGKCRQDIDSEIELDNRLRSELLAEPVDSSALEQRVRETIGAEPQARFSGQVRIAVRIAAMLLLTAAALVTARALFHKQPMEICSDAARDHVREIVQQEPRRWTSDRTRIGELSQRVGVSPSAVSRFNVPGYQLERGRLCRLDGRAFLHLVYSNGVREFSLFLATAVDSNPSGALYAADFGAEHTASIRSGQARAVVVTGESDAAARNLARVAANAL